MRAVPGKVIKVKREEKTGWIERLYVPMIVQGLAVTSRHFFRNLRGFVTGKNRTDFVVQYPEERVDYADAFWVAREVSDLEDLTAFSRAVFGVRPVWLRALFRLRSWLVSRGGLPRSIGLFSSATRLSPRSVTRLSRPSARSCLNSL